MEYDSSKILKIPKYDEKSHFNRFFYVYKPFYYEQTSPLDVHTYAFG